MQELTIDEMGPRGRAVHEFGTRASETLATDPDLGLAQKLHTAFVYGFEAALALHAMDAGWARDALEQLDDWQEKRWGDEARRARQKLLQDARVIQEPGARFSAICEAE